MTTTRYLLARLALAFGFSRKQRRMAEAANESHLLREAEQCLGQRIWERVESVEALGIEYWNLRRMMTEQKQLQEKLESAEDLLKEAHDQRASLLSDKSGLQTELDAKRAELLGHLDKLSLDRDEVINQARQLRRLYDGLKTKLEVLKAESKEDAQTTVTTKQRMAELRADFDTLKQRRDQVGSEIEARNAEVEQLESKLDAERKRHRSEAAEAFQIIGEANRKISSYKAEIGILETQMLQLYGEIGRHVSRNVKTSADCRQAVDDCKPLVEVMIALRRSIILNHRLSGES